MTDQRLDRRRLLVAASATGLAVTATSSFVRAQDSGTPEAGTPEAQSEGNADLAQVPQEPEELGPTVPAEFTDLDTNWPTEHGDLHGTRAARASSITADNIDELAVAWKLTINTPGSYGSVTAAPVIVSNTVYVADMQSNIWSIDKESGSVNWTKEYNVTLVGPNGLAVAYGRVYGVLGDTAEVVSIDAATGDEYWRVKLSNNPREGIDIAPFVHGNIVYVSTVPGNTSNFYQGGTKGILYALDASTGATLFQWDTTTDGLWGNLRVNSGGGLWHPPVADDNGNLYFCVANAAPFPGNEEFPNASSRPGENLYTNCLVSFDPIAGKVRWYISIKPYDLFDLDVHLSPILAKLTIQDQERLVVFASGKPGIVVAADAETGVELWRTTIAKQQNADLRALPLDEFVEVYPGNHGGVETPFAYADGVLYFAVLEMASWYNATGYQNPLLDLNNGTGHVIALDATNGNELWSSPIPTPAYGSIVVANDVVFSGGLDGVILGFNATTGEQIFSHQAGSGLNAPASISGDYLFVPATGPLVPSEASAADVTPAQELIAFRIGGNAESTPVS